jgi:thymidylate synthase (FAD)
LIEYVSGSNVELIKTNASDDDVAMAAWVSNNLDSEERLENRGRVQGLINYLYREQHMSPFEHGSFTFKVDTPIFVTREFQRHRTWSYNEVSGRYTELKPRFYIPAKDRPLIQQGKIGNYYFTPGTDEQYVQMIASKKRSIETAWKEYQFQLELGIAREVARDELPLTTMTQFYATANPRNVMQFLILRTAPNALYEIREVANKVESYFASALPMTYAVFEETRERLANEKSYESQYRELLKKYNDMLEKVELHGHEA